MKEKRKGWKWNSTKNGGFWSKITGESHKHKTDFFCPHCSRPTGTIDNQLLLTLGICAKCYVLYVESRESPVIDLSKYSKIDITNLDLSNKDFLQNTKI